MRHPAFDIDDSRPAAILVPIVELDGEAAIVATQRQADMRSHRDDWVFPGGQVEPGDASSADAARREASEELGIDAGEIEFLGQLDTHGPIVTGYLVEVFVGLLAPGVVLDPDRLEVADVVTVPLGDLIRPNRSFFAPMPTFGRDEIEERARTREGRTNPLRWYELRPDAHLWGMQGNIVFNLLQHLTDGAHHTGAVAGS